VGKREGIWTDDIDSMGCGLPLGALATMEGLGSSDPRDLQPKHRKRAWTGPLLLARTHIPVPDRHAGIERPMRLRFLAGRM
jgi:hypothetical protein